MTKLLSLLLSLYFVWGSGACLTAGAAVVPPAGKIEPIFEANRGQAPPDVQFLSRASNYFLRFLDDRIHIVSPAGPEFAMRFAGSDCNAAWSGEQQLEGITNYFRGSDPSKWVTAVPNFQAIRRTLYKGIDVEFRGDAASGAVEYRFHIAAHADPALIRILPDTAPRIDAGGNLIIATDTGEYRHAAPKAFQQIAGKRIPVDAAFTLTTVEEDRKQVLIRLGAYDSNYPLIIDPILTLHTYQGGRSNDQATALVVSPDGSAHYTGWSESLDLYLAGSPFQDVNKGRRDAFVTRFYPDGRFLFGTYIGGDFDDVPTGIALDSFGNVFLTGTTYSTNFPISSSAYQPAYGGSGDAFLVKMTAQGTSLFQSTYLGGSSYDFAQGVASDSAGNATIVGYTASLNFPTYRARQGTFGGGAEDIFLFKLHANGSQAVYSTYFGGGEGDQAYAVALDGAGNAYVTGRTTCAGLPVGSTLGPGGGTDVLVFKWRPDGDGALYVTCVGGAGIDTGSAIAVDAAGNAYVAGATASNNFPLASPLQNSYGGSAGLSVGDAMLFKLDPTGSNLLYSTYLGGVRDDFAQSVAVDKTGAAWVAGITQSAAFPNTGGQTVTDGVLTAFLTRLAPTGSTLWNAWFLAPVPTGVKYSVALDTLQPAQGVYVAGGVTQATVLPSARKGPERQYLAGDDAWFGKLATTRIQLFQETYPATIPSGTDFTFIQRVANRGPDDADRVAVQGKLPLGMLFLGCTASAGASCTGAVLGDSYRMEAAALGAGRTIEIAVTVRVQALPTGFALPVTATALSDTYDAQQSDNVITPQFFTAPAGTFCNYSAGALTTTLPSTGGPTTFLVNAPQFCPWTVNTPTDWLTIATPSAATGNGSVTIVAAANSSPTPRIGSVTIGGQRFAILQRGASEQPFFTDVPVNHPFFDTIQILRTTGVTSGCDTNTYCPEDTTTRGQMAVFIIRSLLGTDDFSFTGTPYFSDVPANHPQFKWIQKLRELGVTNGCTLSNYCPDDPVNRSQMAAFLIRARLGIAAGQTFPFADTFSFTDVPPTFATYNVIQKMRELGITSGCTASTYCPNDFTTRGQMSSFLARALLTP